MHFNDFHPPIFKVKKSNDEKIHIVGIDDDGGKALDVFYKNLSLVSDKIYLNRITTRFSSSPDFIVEEDDTTHVLWAQYENGNNYIKYLKIVNGNKNIKNLTEIKYYTFQNIILEMDVNKTLFICWIDYNNKNYDICYKYSDDSGDSWSSDMKIVEKQCLIPNYKLIVSDTTPTIVWIDLNNGTINHKTLST